MSSNLLIADSETLTRLCLQQIITTEMFQKKATEVTTCSQLQKILAQKTHTHLITDLYLPDGGILEILPNIRKLYPRVRILIFSSHSYRMLKQAMHSFQVHAYIAKSDALEDITANIDRFLRNEPLPVRSQDIVPPNPFEDMPARELDVLHYLLQGLGTKEIAKTLNLSWSTVSTLKKRIFERVGVETLKDLIDLANLYNVY